MKKVKKMKRRSRRKRRKRNKRFKKRKAIELEEKNNIQKSKQFLLKIA